MWEIPTCDSITTNDDAGGQVRRGESSRSHFKRHWPAAVHVWRLWVSKATVLGDSLSFLQDTHGHSGNFGCWFSCSNGHTSGTRPPTDTSGCFFRCSDIHVNVHQSSITFVNIQACFDSDSMNGCADTCSVDEGWPTRHFRFPVGNGNGPVA